MKKLLAIVFALTLILSVFNFSVSANEDLVIDMSAVVGKAGFNENSPCGLWPAAGYTDKHVVAFCNYGAYASLGNVDLSKYKAVVVTYARSQATDYAPYNTAFAITTAGAIQQSGSAAIDDATAGVVAKYVFDGVVEGSWQGRVDVTIDLNSNHNGEVFVANYLDPAYAHGFVVTGVKFIAKDAVNPETFDMGILPLVLVTAAGFTTLKKRKES